MIKFLKKLWYNTYGERLFTNPVSWFLWVFALYGLVALTAAFLMIAGSGLYALYMKVFVW